MNRMIVFTDPALAQRLREAGFSVLRQGCAASGSFVVPESQEVLAALRGMKQTFGEGSLAYVKTLNF